MVSMSLCLSISISPIFHRPRLRHLVLMSRFTPSIDIVHVLGGCLVLITSTEARLIPVAGVSIGLSTWSSLSFYVSTMTSRRRRRGLLVACDSAQGSDGELLLYNLVFCHRKTPALGLQKVPCVAGKT